VNFELLFFSFFNPPFSNLTGFEPLLPSFFLFAWHLMYKIGLFGEAAGQRFFSSSGNRRHSCLYFIVRDLSSGILFFAFCPAFLSLCSAIDDDSGPFFSFPFHTDI